MKINYKLFVVVGIVVYALTVGIVRTNAQSAAVEPTAGVNPPTGVRNTGLRADNKMMRQENQGIRADFKDVRKGEMEGLKDQRMDLRNDMRNASITPAQKAQMMREGQAKIGMDRKAMMEKVKVMRQEAFTKVRENNNKQLDNVSKIIDGAYTKLSTAVSKLSDSNPGTAESKKLLAAAEVAIKKAKADILAFKNFKPQVVTPATATGTVTPTDNTTGPEVDIEKPRALAQAARTSIEAAHKALRAVAISINYSPKAKLEGDRGTMARPAAEPAEPAEPAI